MTASKVNKNESGILTHQKADQIKITGAMVLYRVFMYTDKATIILTSLGLLRCLTRLLLLLLDASK